MKRRSFLAPLAALAVTSGLFSPAFAAEKPAVHKGSKTQAIADSPRPTETVRVAAVGATDVAALRAAYGIVARLPKDVEGFSANYRITETLTGIANSKWATTLMSLPPIQEEAEFKQMITQWNSPQGVQVRGVLDGIFGQEVTIVMPAGFSAKLKPLLDAYMAFFGKYMESTLLNAMSGKKMGPQEVQAMMRDAAPELLPAVAKADIPPIMIIAKAGKSKELIDGAFGKLLSMVGTELPPAFEAGSFKVDKYEFKSVTVIAKKLIAAFQEEQFKLQLRELMGDDAKAKEVLDLILLKRAEISWGWVEDYFVLSIGADHSHVKFAATDADSALSIPEVAVRAAEFAGKKPIGFSYTSRTVFDKMAAKIEFAGAFDAAAEQLGSILKPDAIAGMKADVKKLEARAQSIFTPTYDASVEVAWLDAGLHGEVFGGYRNAMIDSSKPLAFSSLLSPTTALLLDGRSSVNSKLAVDFVEEGAVTLYSWYTKYGQSMIPENERQGVAMVETLALPMIKQAWNSGRLLGKALGDESALVVDLNGTMPKIPDMPPFLSGTKIPRIAWVAELKDRAAVSESWKGFSAIIKQISALAAESAPQLNLEPKMVKDGDVEIHFVPLPIPVDTGDVLPHIAISKNRWILSTSPSFSKEIAAKPAGAGTALGGKWIVNFTALWDFADGWLTVLDKNAEQMLGPGDAREFKEARPIITTIVKLARSFETFEFNIFEEAGKARMSVHFKIQELK